VLYRVCMWDPILKKQIEPVTAASVPPSSCSQTSTLPRGARGRMQAEHIRFADAAASYLIAYRYKRDGAPPGVEQVRRAPLGWHRGRSRQWPRNGPA
jgi:hypothetical protein